MAQVVADMPAGFPAAKDTHAALRGSSEHRRYASAVFVMYKHSLHGSIPACLGSVGLAAAVVSSAARRAPNSMSSAYDALWCGVHRRAVRKPTDTNRKVLHLLAGACPPVWVSQVVLDVQRLARPLTDEAHAPDEMLHECAGAPGIQDADAARRLLALCHLVLAEESPETAGEGGASPASQPHAPLLAWRNSVRHGRCAPTILAAASTSAGEELLRAKGSAAAGDRFRDMWPPPHSQGQRQPHPGANSPSRRPSWLRTPYATTSRAPPPVLHAPRPEPVTAQRPPPTSTVALWEGVDDLMERRKEGWMLFCDAMRRERYQVLRGASSGAS